MASKGSRQTFCFVWFDFFPFFQKAASQKHTRFFHAQESPRLQELQQSETAEKQVIGIQKKC